MDDLVYNCVIDFGTRAPEHVRRTVVQCLNLEEMETEIGARLVGLWASGYNIDIPLPTKFEPIAVSMRTPKPAI